MKKTNEKTQEWNEIFANWRKSGESQRAYCRHSGISVSSFGYWYRKLKNEDREHGMVKVDRHIAPISVAKTINARAGGVQVNLTGDETEEVLIRVFRALQAVS